MVSVSQPARYHGSTHFSIPHLAIRRAAVTWSQTPCEDSGAVGLFLDFGDEVPYCGPAPGRRPPLGLGSGDVGACAGRQPRRRCFGDAEGSPGGMQRRGVGCSCFASASFAQGSGLALH